VCQRDATFHYNSLFVLSPVFALIGLVKSFNKRKHIYVEPLHYSVLVCTVFRIISNSLPNLIRFDKNNDLDGWLTVHRSITLVGLQRDAQNSYLFTYSTFIKILYMFRALPCSSPGGLRRSCIHAASGIVTLCR